MAVEEEPARTLRKLAFDVRRRRREIIADITVRDVDFDRGKRRRQGLVE